MPKPTTTLKWEVLPIDTERAYCAKCDARSVMLGRDYKDRPKLHLCLECYSLRVAGVKIGLMGGSKRSDRKAAASRENGKKGERPRKVQPVIEEVKPTKKTRKRK